MRLKVGDMAVVTASKFYPETVGEIVTIIGDYRERLCRMPDGSERRMLRYLVRRSDGTQGASSFRNLAPLPGNDVALTADSEALASS